MPPFKFILPTLAQLTRHQRQAINETNSIIVTGVPGSGKTVVSIYRLLNSNNAELFTYTRMLKTSIAHSAISHNINAARKISSVHAWYWARTHRSLIDAIDNDDVIGPLRDNHIRISELIVDEAQDLPTNFYRAITQVCDKVSIGADDAQQLFNVDTREFDLKRIFSGNTSYELGQNFRNRYEIFNFARQFMPNNPRANDSNVLERLRMENSGGELPFVYINNLLSEQKKFIQNILDNNRNKNIAILVYHQATVDRYFDLINSLNNNFECSKYHNGIPNDEKQIVESNLKNILVTTFHSSKGLEFDIVILPEFEAATINNCNLYYVAATRAKDNLFVICSHFPSILNDFDETTYLKS